MNSPERKYLSEFAVSLYSARWLMIPADQIGSGGQMDSVSEEISRNCHIYLICKRPGFTYSEKTFQYLNGSIVGHLQYKIAGEARFIPFSQPYALLDGGISVRLSPYPHREIQTIDAKDKIVRYLPASALNILSGGHTEIAALRNLEVLYVGQAYGDGTRTAYERISSHATLQKILANIHYNSPDDEVFVLTFEYVPYQLITMFDGTSKTAIRDDRDGDRFLDIFENPLTEEQQISLVEAGLIRYFQPVYNEIYKDTFPSPDHKILKECYERDFSGLIVEINTDEIEFCLYSPRVEPKYHHIAQFDLIDPTERLSFFSFKTDDGKVSAHPGVISPSK